MLPECLAQAQGHAQGNCQAKRVKSGSAGQWEHPKHCLSVLAASKESQRAAIHSISTFAPSGSFATSTVERAGA